MDYAQLSTSIQHLREQVRGNILTPNDRDYDQTRRAWNLAKEQRPAIIVVAENAEDVMASIRFARESGLSVSVQATGHGMQQPADDHLLIITSRMKAVQVDAQARTARAEAGALWVHVLEQSTPHGLAPLLGSSPHVGVVGYTLGGGIGWLGRKYGLAADSVRSIDLVTADGVLRHASPTENSDLFWGVRGGGSNFGVVTSIVFSLYPVETLYGGNLIYSGELAGEALHFFRDWVKTIPDELTSSIIVLKIPPLPQIPEALHGKIQVIVRAAYTGDAAEGAAWMQKWLDWNTPVTNTFHEMPFSEVGMISNDSVEPIAGIGSNEMLDDLSDEAITVIVRNATNPASPLSITEIRHVGGAIARVATDANAIGNRDAQFYLNLAGLTPKPEMQPLVKQYIRAYKAELRPYLRGGIYLNFVGISEEARERGKDAYLPETLKRLLELKAKYDPDNMFRFSYQLTPE